MLVAKRRVAQNKKSRRGRIPSGIRPRRLTRQPASRHSRVAFCFVIRQFRWKAMRDGPQGLPTKWIIRPWAKKSRGPIRIRSRSSAVFSGIGLSSSAPEKGKPLIDA